MNRDNENIAFAALDIGTSVIKLGVYCPGISKEIIFPGRINNELIYAAGGSVLSDYHSMEEKVFELFGLLGHFLSEKGIEKCYIGICSHVSSLLEWDDAIQQPVRNRFSVWLDSTSSTALEELEHLTGGERALKNMASYLPLGTNWLLTKLMAANQAGFLPGTHFIQAGDAIFTKLTNSLTTHFSAQVSMVHQTGKTYVRRYLEYLGLEEARFPEITEQSKPVLPEIGNRFGFPEKTFVFPSMADFYASFLSMTLHDGDAFILGNTSEIAGFYFKKSPLPGKTHMVVALDDGFVSYGSANTGGNLVTWFIENILGNETDEKILSALTTEAEQLKPSDCPVFIPYLEGERAPFWNSALTASFIGLRTIHTRAHLFRSILESIAFARRQSLLSINGTLPGSLFSGGGTSKNSLLNLIRASVLGREIQVSEDPELAIRGLINHMTAVKKGKDIVNPPAATFNLVKPDPSLRDEYQKKYNLFLTLQKQLNISYE